VAAAVSRAGAVVIANPAAGAAGPELVARVLRRCTDRIPDTRLHLTEGRGHARRLAERADVRDAGLLVVVGGDGTISEVVDGLVAAGRTPPPLAVVPAGTGNSLHREVWGALTWADTLEAALDPARSRVRTLDLIRFAGTGGHAALGVASGLVAEALVTARGLTDVSGPDRYSLAIAKTLADFEPYPGRVLVDGVELHRGPTVLANVGGGRYRGGRYQLLPHSIMDDGLLDVCVVDGALDPRCLPGLTADGAHVGRPEVRYARGRRTVLERTDGEALVFEHDGEVHSGPDRRRVDLEVIPNALPVLAPAV
jgi:diacylglycerol kinase (ATP)